VPFATAWRPGKRFRNPLSIVLFTYQVPFAQNVPDRRNDEDSIVGGRYHPCRTSLIQLDTQNLILPCG
jgi:hypothetical protein